MFEFIGSLNPFYFNQFGFGIQSTIFVDNLMTKLYFKQASRIFTLKFLKFTCR